MTDKMRTWRERYLIITLLWWRAVIESIPVFMMTVLTLMFVIEIVHELFTKDYSERIIIVISIFGFIIFRYLFIKNKKRLDKVKIFERASPSNKQTSIAAFIFGFLVCIIHGIWKWHNLDSSGFAAIGLILLSFIITGFVFWFDLHKKIFHREYVDSQK